MDKPLTLTQISNRFRNHTWLLGVAVLLVLLLIYQPTIQKDINGSSHDYLLDTGEIQVALNTWGTIHYTGYPHYTILSTIVTQIFRGTGIGPAAAASLSSLVWSFLSLYVAYRLLIELSEGEQGLAALAVLVLGLTETFWIHSVIAEVYSFSFLLTMLLFWLSFQLRNQWQIQKWLLFVFLMGMAVFHHRILLLLLPPLILMGGMNSWRQLRRQPRLIIVTLLLFLSPLVFYLYLPLRAWQGADWVYGQPGTWDGFWLQFTGGEVTGGLLRPPQNLQSWSDNLRLLLSHLQAQLPVIGLVWGFLGLLWFTKKDLWQGLSLWGAAAVFPIFIIVFPRAVWIPAVLMPTLFVLIAGMVILWQQAAQYKAWWRWVGGLALIAAAVWLYQRNYPLVTGYVHDPAGRMMIELLKPLPADGTGVVALPWGQGYFAAAYGQLVTHELAAFPLVDHRANFPKLINIYNEIWTPASYLNYWPPDWWSDRLDSSLLHYHTVIRGVVAIRQQPTIVSDSTPPIFTFANNLGVKSARLSWLDQNTLHLNIEWQTLGFVDQDYHVALHLLAQAPPVGPQDIIAQADAVHPVLGWYPTSKWQVGEWVADDYLFSIPPNTKPVAIWVTFYTQDATGNFINQPWYMLPISPLEQ